MLARLKRLLRGDYNSIRYRYFQLPREWFRFLVVYRLRGKSWIDFYADRLDTFASTGDAISESYLEGGEEHLAYLRKHGLKPTDRVLDYGCGVMRTGLHLVRFLETGNYTGADISEARIARGKKLLAVSDIPDETYRAILVRDCKLAELAGEEFDVIWANSVATHMPEPDIKIMLATMRGLLAETGSYYFTFAASQERKRKNIKDFWYPTSTMATWAANASLDFEILDDWPDRGDVMARVRPTNVEGR